VCVGVCSCVGVCVCVCVCVPSQFACGHLLCLINFADQSWRNKDSCPHPLQMFIRNMYSRSGDT